MCIAFTTLGLTGCGSVEQPSEPVQQQEEDPQAIKNRAMERVLEDKQIVMYATFDNTTYDKSILMVGKTYELDSQYTPSQDITYYEYDPQNKEYVSIEGVVTGSGSGFAGSGHGAYLLDSEGNLYRYEIAGGTGLYQYDKFDMTDGQYKFTPFLSGSKAEEQQKNLPPADEEIIKNLSGLKWQANTTNPKNITEEDKKREELVGNQIATVTLRYVNSDQIDMLLEGKDVPTDDHIDFRKEYYLIAIFPKDYIMPGEDKPQPPVIYFLKSPSESHDYFRKYLPLDYLDDREVALAFDPVYIGKSDLPGLSKPINSISNARIL